MFVRAGMQLQILYVFAVQLHVELLQGLISLPQRGLQAEDPLYVFFHQVCL